VTATDWSDGNFQKVRTGVDYGGSSACWICLQGQPNVQYRTIFCGNAAASASLFHVARPRLFQLLKPSEGDQGSRPIRGCRNAPCRARS